jgi:hypothetical protein
LDFLTQILTAGGSATFMGTLLVYFLKKDRKEIEQRYLKHERHLQDTLREVNELRRILANIRSDLSELQIQMARVSTVVDLVMSTAKKNTN